MNAPTSAVTFAIHTADLGDARESARIDAFVRAHRHGTPFHLAAWSRAVERGSGAKSHYLIASRGGEIVGALPLNALRSRLFGNALVSAGFAVGGGVLVAEGGAAHALAEAAIGLSRRIGCPSIELRGGVLPDDDWHVVHDSHAGFTRSLAEDDDAELRAIPRKQRAEVRRALGFDLAVEIGRSERDRAAHYAVYAESVRNLGTPVFPRGLFDAVLDELGDDADILTVRHEDKAIASVLSLYFGGAVMPYWGGGTIAARRWRANDLMYFALMRHARARGCVRFDFGRSKTGSGAFAFKRNWGFDPVPLAYAHWTSDGGRRREVNPADPRYRMRIALWKKLPLPVANRVGPLIARGLG